MSKYENVLFNTGTINGNIQQTYSKNTKYDNNSTNKDYKDDNNLYHENQNYKYDVAISYAGEQELYVSRVVRILEKEKIKVFFAPNREEEFIGRDMITEFYDIYRYKCLFVAAFVSKEYLQKDITMHEARTALLREKEEKRNCLIPIYFNGARLNKANPDINYLNAETLREVEIADKIKLIINYHKTN